MSVVLNPYLSFRTNAREAMEFYRAVLGGELTISTFADLHASEDPAEQNLVMHSVLTTPNGLTLMGADTPSTMEFRVGTNYSVSLSGDDEPTLRGYFDGLSDGGTPGVPLEKAPWGDSFGMFTDRFGVSWLINISGA